jgi:hypothetical protein
MAAEELLSLTILPAITSTVIIGAYELFLIHRDENYSGSHWFGHGLHTFLPIFIGLLISFNVAFFLQQFGGTLPLWIQNELMIRVAIALILAIKVRAISAVVPGSAGRGMKEGWIHTLIIGAAVALFPYLWPIAMPFLPRWAGGTN